MVEVWKTYLWVALGSAIGGVSRFWVSGMIANRIGGAFPWGTILVNISGSMLIGFLGGLTDPAGRMSPTVRTVAINFLMIGVCGGYTTFSSFSLQTLNLLREGEFLFAGGNVLLSVICCIFAVWLGFIAGQILIRSL
jgi:CrcB protein